MKQNILNTETRRHRDSFLLFSLCLCVSVFILSACDRRELTYYTEAEVTITADWNRPGLTDDPYGATTVFYPQDGGEPVVVLMGDKTRETVRLRRGSYHAVIFNRSFDDFRAIAFRGREACERLEAYNSRIQNRVQEITESPETFAAGHIEGFEVTESMLGNYTMVMRNRSTADGACTVSFTPEKLTWEVKTIVHIRGMNNVRQAYCTLDGVPASVFLATGQPSDELTTQRFLLENPVFDPGSAFDGTMTGTFNVFGFDQSTPHNLHIEALLVDGKTVYSEDIRGVKVTATTGAEGEIIIHIEAATERIDDVKPEGGSDSGFGADVEDWGEEVNSEVPVI